MRGPFAIPFKCYAPSFFPSPSLNPSWSFFFFRRQPPTPQRKVHLPTLLIPIPEASVVGLMGVCMNIWPHYPCRAHKCVNKTNAEEDLWQAGINRPRIPPVAQPPSCGSFLSYSRGSCVCLWMCSPVMVMRLTRADTRWFISLFAFFFFVLSGALLL